MTQMSARSISTPGALGRTGAWVARVARFALAAAIAGLPLQAGADRSEESQPRIAPAESTTDAVRASPDRFRTLLENEHVRVLEYTLRPGERDQWHTHPPKVSYVVHGGRLRIHLADGSAFDTGEIAGTAAWMESVPRHYAENVGDTPVTIVLTEVKSAAMGAGDDGSRVVDAVEAFFAAAAVGDLASFHDVVTPDFEAFEVGKRYTGDELMAVLRGKQAAGTVYVWNVTEPKVSIDGRTAWVTYTNRGSITDGAGRKDLQWLESAVLRRDGDGWRMRFLHSTRVP